MKEATQISNRTEEVAKKITVDHGAKTNFMTYHWLNRREGSWNPDKRRVFSIDKVKQQVLLYLYKSKA